MLNKARIYNTLQKLQSGTVTARIFFMQALKAAIKKQDPWKKFIPMPIEEAKRFLKRDLPDSTVVMFDFGKNGTGCLTMIASGVFVDKRNFDLKKGIVTEGYMAVDQNQQGKNIGRNIMRNEIEFFQMCGVNRFSIQAGAAAGGYTWSRFGFLPEYGGIVRDQLRERYRAIRPLLTRDEKNIVQRGLRFKSNADLWKVADTDIDVSDRIKYIFNSSGMDQNSLKYQLVETIGAENISDYCGEGKKAPVGRILLAGMSWPGYLDFNEKDQMNRAEKYVGGWKSLRLQ